MCKNDCKHLKAVHDSTTQMDHCPDCGKRRPKNSGCWQGPPLKCSDCGEFYEYKERWPIPDFYQPRCPDCLKKISQMVAFKPKTWDDKFFQLCDTVATWSKDQSTKLGCVIVGPDHEIRSVGYNGLPRGCNDNVAARQQRPLKYRYFAHAEENAIANAARVGTPLKGCILYCQWICCSTCARMIIGTGIREVKCRDLAIPDRRVADVLCAMEMIVESSVMMYDAGKILRELKRRGTSKV